MKKINRQVLIIKNKARLNKMIRENVEKKRITQQRKRLEKLKEEARHESICV